MQIGSHQSSTLLGVDHGGKRPGVIDSAAYAHGLRVANVEIADISEEIKHEDRFVWVGLYEPDEELLREIQQELGPPTTWRSRMLTARTSGQSWSSMRIASLWCCARRNWSASRVTWSLVRRTSLWDHDTSFL
jgi:hypothetical protein